MRDRASRALSIPVALRAGFALFDAGASRSDRSRPRPAGFFGAALEAFGLLGREASSSFSRASFSTFLRAASAFLASASSLVGVSIVRRMVDEEEQAGLDERFLVRFCAFAPFFLFYGGFL